MCGYIIYVQRSIKYIMTLGNGPMQGIKKGTPGSITQTWFFSLVQCIKANLVARSLGDLQLITGPKLRKGRRALATDPHSAPFLLHPERKGFRSTEQKVKHCLGLLTCCFPFVPSQMPIVLYSLSCAVQSALFHTTRHQPTELGILLSPPPPPTPPQPNDPTRQALGKRGDFPGDDWCWAPPARPSLFSFLRVSLRPPYYCTTAHEKRAGGCCRDSS